MTYISSRKPREKQQEALLRGKGKAAFGYLMSMRTGKTKVILDEFGALEASGVVKDLLVVAPAGALDPWVGEIVKDFSETLYRRTRVFRWVSDDKNKAEYKEALRAFMAFKGPRVFLVNVEALSLEKMGVRELCNAFVARGALTAVDESTVIKNPDAKRAEYVVYDLGPRSKVRRILTGLINPRSPLDVYMQMEFLDRNILGFRDYFAFRHRYAIMQKIRVGKRMVNIVVGYRNVKELADKIAPHTFRVRLEDCYDVPEKEYQIRHVEMTKEQKRIYNEIVEFASAKLSKDSFMTAGPVVTQLLRMHQVLCGHATDDKTKAIKTIPENRTQTVLDILETYEGKAIIWCSYDHDVNKVATALRKEFGDKSVARFWGGNLGTREAEEQEFKTSPDCRFMVATPSAGGRGREWSTANLVVYYSNLNNLEHRAQSEDRPQAVGKKDHVTYIDLVTPNTFDVKLLTALKSKIDMATLINRDNWKEWVI